MKQPRKPALRKWPADTVERWPLERIRPYPNNARTHSDEQIEQIAASMQRFGVTTPVLVDEDGELIYGHGRLRAAQQLGYEELPVAIARGWSEDEKRGYRIADNQLALTSSWDMPLLSAEVGLLHAAGFDMPLLGFSADELPVLIDGWSTDIDVRERFGANTDGITAVLRVEVAQADGKRAAGIIGQALTQAGIAFSISGRGAETQSADGISLREAGPHPVLSGKPKRSAPAAG